MQQVPASESSAAPARANDPELLLGIAKPADLQYETRQVVPGGCDELEIRERGRLPLMPYVHVRLRIIGSSQPNNVVATDTRTHVRDPRRGSSVGYVLDTVDYIDRTVLNATELDGAIRR